MYASYIIGFAAALLIHEMGHLVAARACRVKASEIGFGWGPGLLSKRVGGIQYKLHALPVGAYVRLDMAQLQQRPLSQQLLVLLGGIIINLLAGLLTYGTFFSIINLLLAVTNLLPLYQQDGWKCGMVLARAALGRKSPLVEWSFTIAGGGLALLILILQILQQF